MGGIGKTALARASYNDPCLVNPFDIRAWITVSQEYQVRKMLLGILRCVTDLSDANAKTNDELAEQLYKSLKFKRFLIVLDDVWCIEVWDDVKRSFPDDKNGSGIVLTCRLDLFASSKSSPHLMSLLSMDQALKLLNLKVFGKESSPRELEKVGMEIVSRFISGESDQFLSLFALSYNYLPHPLKTCFLYMCAFPKGSMIVVSKLINLWVAEGFIEGTKSKNLEEIAEEYLRDLVSRNLAMVIKRRFNGRVKTCCIHDLLRDSVRREAEKENFLYVVSDHVDVLPGEAYSNRRLILHSEMVAIAEQRPSVPFTYSFLCCIGAGLPPFTSQLRSIIGYLGFKLLRVLDLGSSMFFTFPLEIAQLVNLRYLTLNCYDELPSCISELCHLKILIISSHLEGLALPADSWNMAQLRHVRLTRGCTMPDPMVASALVDGKSSKVLLDLQTLSYISFGSCSTEVFACISQVKKNSEFMKLKRSL
ncbi:putative late blight resistance protein homolog R1A-10 [Nicotiana sylvestris]|uniref:putative late blight resistance protein homolog R1A-10 n=1 Tax=Nicotiana sylvestris TaxID=4096 RepID=UPI00388CBF72